MITYHSSGVVEGPQDVLETLASISWQWDDLSLPPAQMCETAWKNVPRIA